LGRARSGFRVRPPRRAVSWGWPEGESPPLSRAIGWRQEGPRCSGDGTSHPRWTARRTSGSEGRISRAPPWCSSSQGSSTRGRTPQELARLVRGGPTSQCFHTRVSHECLHTSVSEVHRSFPARWERPPRAWEARGAAERGRGSNVSLTGEAGDRCWLFAREPRRVATRRLRTWFDRPGAGGSWVLDLRLGARTWQARVARRGFPGTDGRGVEPFSLRSRDTPNPDTGWSKL